MMISVIKMAVVNPVALARNCRFGDSNFCQIISIYLQ